MKDFFGFLNLMDDVFGKAMKKDFESVFDGKNEDGDDGNLTNSYSRFVSKKYSNGKLVEHVEKEYKNGECTKNINEKALDAPSNDKDAEKLQKEIPADCNNNMCKCQKKAQESEDDTTEEPVEVEFEVESDDEASEDKTTEFALKYKDMYDSEAKVNACLRKTIAKMKEEIKELRTENENLGIKLSGVAKILNVQ